MIAFLDRSRPGGGDLVAWEKALVRSRKLKLGP